jgi:SAM-dependent methyltransferase
MTASSTFVSADGDAYERLMGRWSRRLAEPFLDFVGTKEDEAVLDLGCGTGGLTDALMKRCSVRQVRGIDFSPAYVEHAKRHHRDPRVSFEVGDACALTLPERSFDRVLSLLMLHFVPRAEQAAAEMRRVARPGAVVGAAVWDARGGFVATRIFYDTAAVLDPAADVLRGRSYTRPMTRPGELASAWRAAGLADVVETLLSIRMDFECFDDYWSPYTGKEGQQAEYLATLSDADRSRLRDAVRRAYIDGEPDGPRSYAAMAWAVKGVVPHE